MVIQIITDSSFCPEHKIGTFAFYINSKSGTIATCGILQEAKDPMECEMKAVANALHALRRSSMNRGEISFIEIHSDCLNMFKKISKKTENPIGIKIMEQINKIKQNSNLDDKRSMFFKMIHVKAHTNNSDPLSTGNRYCHDMAIQMLRVHRESIKHDEASNIKSGESKSGRPGKRMRENAVDKRSKNGQPGNLPVSMRSSS